MELDFERLRDDLINYFGTAMSYYPQAVIELSNVERASNNELISIALKNGFDLDEYVLNLGRGF